MDNNMNEDNVKRLALIIAANCIDKSVIETSNNNKEITDDQLKAFNKQLSDKIYTFLSYLLNKPANEYSLMMDAMSKNYPDRWPLPCFDEQLLEGVNKLGSAT